MVLNTFTVGAAVTPSVIGTAISHYTKRKPLRGRPTAHISYDEGLHLIRRFLRYASNHTIEELQTFTAQWVPNSHWVKLDGIVVAERHLTTAAEHIQVQLGPRGIELVGGVQWWQWRPKGVPLKADWIEMRAHYNARKVLDAKAQRLMLYIHGGAYYFGSVDEHRYQLQRHARKLKARLLAPRYRLAPQFPFPCGLQDALACYLMLLEEYDPKTIILAGDSAGGGMTLSLLVILRDRGVPLPAGAVLLSPWVDLTHSFPSVAGDGHADYIPPYGFHHRPSAAWPPPNDEDMRKLNAQVRTPDEKPKSEVPGATVTDAGVPSAAEVSDPPASDPTEPLIASRHKLSLDIDGKHVELLDQIQMYAPNSLLNHPLVSPIMQASLGGLPPLLIQTGSGELLLDEQVYIAHKAAHPRKYAPADVILDEHDTERKALQSHPPTWVQLQVWEDLCHVPHTLSFTKPAKHMYRAVAQFGNWCYNNAGCDLAGMHTRKLADDDAWSTISTDTSTSSNTVIEQQEAEPSSLQQSESNETTTEGSLRPNNTFKRSQSLASHGQAMTTVSATEALPPFEHSMIRQLVDRHGKIYPLPSPTDIPCLSLAPAEIGTPKPGPVRKWLAMQAKWDKKFAKSKQKVQSQRLKEMKQGYEIWQGERPPPSALAGRRLKGERENMANLENEKTRRKPRNIGLAMWSGWGSKHDEDVVEHAEQTAHLTNSDTTGEDSTQTEEHETAVQGAKEAKGVTDATSTKAVSRRSSMLSRLSIRSMRDRRTTSLKFSRQSVPTPHAADAASGNPASSTGEETDDSMMDASIISAALPDVEKVEGSDNTFLSPDGGRPHNGTVAYPFKVKSQLSRQWNASTMTLQSETTESDSNVTENGNSSPGGSRTAGRVKQQLDGDDEQSTLAKGANTDAGRMTERTDHARPNLESFVTAAEF